MPEADAIAAPTEAAPARCGRHPDRVPLRAEAIAGPASPEADAGA